MARSVDIRVRFKGLEAAFINLGECNFSEQSPGGLGGAIDN